MLTWKLFAVTLLAAEAKSGLFAQTGTSTSADNKPSTTSVTIPNQPSKAPEFSFVDPVVRIPVGSQAGSGEITIKGSGLPEGSLEIPSLDDFELPSPLAASVRFKSIQEQAGHKIASTWRYSALVTGLTPANTSQQRYATVNYAGKSLKLAYLLSNQPSTAFSWTISKPADPWIASSLWFASEAVCQTFVVTPKDSPATGVRIQSSTLAAWKRSIGKDRLKLCLAGVPCQKNEILDLPANVPADLQICADHSLDTHGSFRGALSLAAIQKPDGEAILQAAQFSSLAAAVLGFLLIISGVVLAWFVKVYARARLDRDQALLPALLMASRVEALIKSLAALPPRYTAPATQINEAVKTLLQDLEVSNLDKQNFLPPRFPDPRGSNTVDSPGYKTFLEARNPRLQLLSVLVHEGLEKAAAEDDGTLQASQQAFIDAEVTVIDGMWTAVPQPTPDQARLTLVGNIVALHNRIHGIIPPNSAPAPPIIRPVTFDSVQLEIQRTSAKIWLVWGILTSVTGLAALIMAVPGFGAPLDYVFAFFWGFGLPTTVQQLAPGSAATALNVSIVKT